MSYRLAIFDLDGTILDTLEDLKGEHKCGACCKWISGADT